MQSTKASNAIEGIVTTDQRLAQLMSEKISKFSKSGILEPYPEIGKASVENSLKAMCEERLIKKEGKGRATFYYALK